MEQDVAVTPINGCGALGRRVGRESTYGSVLGCQWPPQANSHLPAIAFHTRRVPTLFAVRGGGLMTAEELAVHLDARRTGNGRWLARCPAHRDRSPSLSIASGRENRALVHCWAGCDLAAILKAAGLVTRSLFPAGPSPTREQRDALARQRRAKSVNAVRERQANREIRERVSS